MSYQIGDEIPSITLQDTDGNHVTIKSGTEKTLFYCSFH